MLSYVVVPTTSIRVEENTTAGLSTHVSLTADISSTNLDPVTKSTSGVSKGDVGKYTTNDGRIVHQIYHKYTVSLCIYLY